MEVWKFDFAPEPLAESPNNSPTDERQMQAYEEAVVLFPSAIGRGILRPHALIILPHLVPCIPLRLPNVARWLFRWPSSVPL